MLQYDKTISTKLRFYNIYNRTFDTSLSCNNLLLHFYIPNPFLPIELNTLLLFNYFKFTLHQN